jgi:hypothetical protein
MRPGLARYQCRADRRANGAERSTGADSQEGARKVLDIALARDRYDAHANERSGDSARCLENESARSIGAGRRLLLRGRGSREAERDDN